MERFGQQQVPKIRTIFIDSINLLRYSSAKGFDLYEATQIQDLFNNHGSLLGPNADYEEVTNYLKSFYTGMNNRNVRLAEAGTALVLESLSHSPELTSARVESRFTDWEVRTNVEVQMLQSLGLAPIRRQVPFPTSGGIDAQNQAEMELALRIFTGSNVAVSFNLIDKDPDQKFKKFYRMLDRATSSSGEVLRPTEFLIMPDSYVFTGNDDAFSLVGESKIGPISLGMLMTKTISGPAENIKNFFPEAEYGYRLYNELPEYSNANNRPDESNTWQPDKIEKLSYQKGKVQIFICSNLNRLGDLPYNMVNPI